MLYSYFNLQRDQANHTQTNAGVNVNPHPHPGTRWGLVGKRRGFDRNCIPEGVGDWEIFVFNLPQGRGFGWGFVVSQLL